ncbi:flagellar hook-length control protein [Escherichia coli]|nr:flagellar hook-length control protein [Escherichia coli]
MLHKIFLALLSEALAGETTTDKSGPQLLVATDKPTTKGEPLVSEILADAQQADLLIPVDENTACHQRRTIHINTINHRSNDDVGCGGWQQYGKRRKSG